MDDPTPQRLKRKLAAITVLTCCLSGLLLSTCSVDETYGVVKESEADQILRNKALIIDEIESTVSLESYLRQICWRHSASKPCTVKGHTLCVLFMHLCSTCCLVMCISPSEFIRPSFNFKKVSKNTSATMECTLTYLEVLNTHAFTCHVTSLVTCMCCGTL